MNLLPNRSQVSPQTQRVHSFAFGVLICVLLFSGCGTTTQRTATEQLLISDAVDVAISQIDFRHLEGQSVFLDTKYLKSLTGCGTVNADYIVSSLRQQLTTSRCMVQEKMEDADIVVEPRIGALGTDGHEVTYGIPQSASLSTAANALSGTPVIPPIPEVSFGRNDALSGIAKIIVFAYDRESKQPVWQSGVARAESNSNSTWVLGAGPFQKGTIYEGVRFAGKRIEDSEEFKAAMKSRLPKPALPKPSFAISKPGQEPDTGSTESGEADSSIQLSSVPEQSGASPPDSGSFGRRLPHIRFDDAYVFQPPLAPEVPDAEALSSLAADAPEEGVHVDEDVKQVGFDQPSEGEPQPEE